MFNPKPLATVAVIAAMSLPMGPANAGFVSGWDLLEICKANPQHGGYGIQTSQCRGYITGVSGTFSCTEPLHGFHWDRTTQVAPEDMAKAVISWLNAHPETLRHEADGLVAAALEETYPCR